MMLNCFGIDKLHGFIMHSVVLAVGRILRENYYSLSLSNFQMLAVLIKLCWCSKINIKCGKITEYH